MKIIYLLALFASIVHAQWSDESIKYLSAYRDAPFVYKTAGFVTLWGGVKRYIKGGSLQGEEIKIKFPQFKEPLTIYLRRYKKGAPLVVFFPGIYGNHSGKISPVIINWLERKNVNVLSLPNFLNSLYLEAEPNYRDNDIKTFEKTVAYEVTKKLATELEVKDVILIGESLGTYVALSTIDFLEDDPEFFSKISKVILLWPPLDLSYAIKQFDTRIQKTKLAFENCSYWKYAYSFASQFVFSEYPDEMDKTSESCFESFLFHSVFMDTVLRVQSSYEEISHKEIKAPAKDFSDFLLWYNRRFYTLLHSQDDDLKAKTFFDKWKKLKTSKLLVTTSKDDFINDYSQWKNTGVTPLTFSWGSHCAPLGLDVWGKVLGHEVTHL